MDFLFLGGVFPYDKQSKILKKERSIVNYAANEFQLKVINGIKSNGYNLNVLSAPFIGAYPFKNKDIYFKKFPKDDLAEYVSFLNIWGIRNFSRYYSLKKEIKKFTLNNNEKKVILVYSPHTPFLEAACYAKRVNPKIHICLIVPDLPQYMNLQSGNKIIYNFFKRFDIEKFNNLKVNVDSFVLLTEHMKEVLEIGERPYTIIEGMIEREISTNQYSNDTRNKKSIVYTGTLNEKFGVLNLVEAFRGMDNNELELIICGDGEAKDKIEKEAKIDNRIKFLGQVNIQKSKQIQAEADILVNPRKNNEDYTKYSFPSKTMEYLSTGKPVIAYKLDGIPDEYDDYLFYVNGNEVKDLARCIQEVLKIEKNILEKRSKNVINFLNDNKTNIKMVKKVIEIIS